METRQEDTRSRHQKLDRWSPKADIRDATERHSEHLGKHEKQRHKRETQETRESDTIDLRSKRKDIKGQHLYQTDSTDRRAPNKTEGKDRCHATIVR